MPNTAMTPQDMVRLNVTDLDTGKQLFTDEQLTAWLAHYNGSVNRATARALRTIAVSELLISKVIRSQDLQTNADRVSREMRELAASYDAEAAREEADAEGDDEMLIVNFGGFQRNEGEEYRRW